MSRAPAFYGSLLVCLGAQATVFWSDAPALQAMALPLAISVFAATRLYWCLVRRKSITDEASAEADLRKSTVILVTTLLAVLAADLNLLRYAEADTSLFLLASLLAWCLIAVYCIFYLRIAAIVALLTPYPVLASTWPMIETDVAAGATLVVVGFTVAAAFTMSNHYGDLISLIDARAKAQKLNEENFRLASTDALTGLAGRRQFFADLERFSADAQMAGRRVAVAIADLDGFKPINDRHGHLVGDRVLQVVAQRMSEHSGRFTSVYRLGGDEFALIACELADHGTLMAEANALISHVGRPIALGEIILSTGCSIGIAVTPSSAFTSIQLYEWADCALYHAKRAGRNRALRFTSEHERLIRSQATIEQELRSSDKEREFYPVYQPIVRAQSLEVIGFECLARWQSPVLGDVPPSTFIPVAEQSALLRNLTPILLRKALADAATWPDALRLSFNLSPLDLASSEQIMALIGIVGTSGVSPRRIDFELTETALLHDLERACANMRALQAIGSRVSLDDFGTGYSSLSHLHALTLDKVKIDRSFMRDINQDAQSQTIIRSMLNLCQDLGLDCIVEGVETTEQLELLRSFGCEQIQGYLVGRPMAATAVSTFLADAKLAA